jgi:hypothetical protein
MFIKKIFFIFLLCYHPTQAMNILFIGSEHYSVDHQRHLIVVNQTLSTLNSDSSPKNTLYIDQPYTFPTPVSNFAVGQAYTVIHDNTAQAYQLYFTELPLVDIYTTAPIVDEPSTLARLTLTETDGTHLHSAIGIEYRGAGSLSLPKKSLRIEFWNSATDSSSKSVQLLDLRSDDDWNLQAMYNEPLRLRGKSNNALWKSMSSLYYQAQEPEAVNGIEMRYVEVFIDGIYQGVYALGERVDRKQLQLKKPAPTHNRGQLYKGVNWWPGTVSFTDLYPSFDNRSDFWQGFDQKYPQNRFDWGNLYEFCDFVLNSSDSVFYTDISKHFDLDNAVDYFIFLNLINAGDNTGKNLFIAQYDAGEPFFYVPWDLDGTTGITWSGSWITWQLGLLSNGLYDRLLHDCQPNGFKDLLRKRWRTLRTTFLNKDYYMAYINANYNYLLRNGVYQREAIAWPDYCLNPIDINRTHNWLANRIRELDYRFEEDCIPVINFNPKDVYSFEVDLKVYPTPATTVLYTDYKKKTPAIARLYSMHGQFIREFTITRGHQKHNISYLQRGHYMLYVRNKELQFAQRIVVRNK